MDGVKKPSWGDVAEEKGGCLDFSVNINPLGVPAAVREVLGDLREFTEGYPDASCSELRALLAEKYHVGSEQILCGSGADDLLYRLVFASRPKRAVVIEPTFEEYGRALALVGCEVCHYSAQEKDLFALDEGVLEAVEDGCDMLFLCNPNNPTGRLAEGPLLEKLIGRCREKGVLLVVDESFMEFLPEWERGSCKQRAAREKHLLVLDAFTKTYAMAALRLGFCISGNEALLASMAAWGQAYGVSAPAQLAGLSALQAKDYMAASRELIERERAWLEAALKELPLKVYPSCGNFLLIKAADREIRARLLAEGVKVRDCSCFRGLGTAYCRVAVRSREENAALVAALRKVLS